MTDRVKAGNLRVARVLYDFVNNEALPGTGLDSDSFWAVWVPAGSSWWCGSGVANRRGGQSRNQPCVRRLGRAAGVSAGNP